MTLNKCVFLKEKDFERLASELTLGFTMFVLAYGDLSMLPFFKTPKKS